MEMFNSLKNLIEEICGIYIIHSVVFNDVIKQLTSIGVLHDQVKFILCLDDLVELNDPWVPNLFQDSYLSSNPINVHLIRDFWFFQDLYCNFLLGDSLNSQFYFSECTFSKLFVDEEVRDLFGLFLAKVIARFRAFAHDQELQHILLPLKLCLVLRCSWADVLVKNVIHIL